MPLRCDCWVSLSLLSLAQYFICSYIAEIIWVEAEKISRLKFFHALVLNWKLWFFVICLEKHDLNRGLRSEKHFQSWWMKCGFIQKDCPRQVLGLLWCFLNRYEKNWPVLFLPIGKSGPNHFQRDNSLFEQQQHSS